MAAFASHSHSDRAKKCTRYGFSFEAGPCNSHLTVSIFDLTHRADGVLENEQGLAKNNHQDADNLDELPFQVIYVGDERMLQNLRNHLRWRNRKVRNALAGVDLPRLPTVDGNGGTQQVRGLFSLLDLVVLFCWPLSCAARCRQRRTPLVTCRVIIRCPSNNSLQNPSDPWSTNHSVTDITRLPSTESPR